MRGESTEPLEMDPASLSPRKKKQVFDNPIWDEALGGREILIDSGVNAGTEGPSCPGQVTGFGSGGSDGSHPDLLRRVTSSTVRDRSQGSNR